MLAEMGGENVRTAGGNCSGDDIWGEYVTTTMSRGRNDLYPLSRDNRTL